MADARLFPSETGLTPVWYTNVFDRSILPALDKIGLAYATFQVLRRTWVIEFSAAEKDPAIRAQLTGHTVDVHENEYRQPDPGILRKAEETGKETAMRVLPKRVVLSYVGRARQTLTKLFRIMERETGIEPATNSLEGCDFWQ